MAEYPSYEELKSPEVFEMVSPLVEKQKNAGSFRSVFTRTRTWSKKNQEQEPPVAVEPDRRKKKGTIDFASNRFQTRLTGYGECSEIVTAWSPSKYEVAFAFTASYKSPIIYTWNCSSGMMIRELKGPHTTGITRLNVVHLQQENERCLLASGDLVGLLVLWDIITGEESISFDSGHQRVTQVTSGMDCVRGHRVVISAGSDKTAKVWDTSGNLLSCFQGGHTASVSTVALCCVCEITQDTLLFTGSFDHTIVMWDFHKVQQIRRLLDHNWYIMAIDVYVPRDKSPPVMVSASADRFVKIWDIATGKVVRSLEHDNFVRDVSIFKPKNGEMPIIVSISLNKVSIWDLVTGELIRYFDDLAGRAFTVCAFESRDTTGLIVISGSDKGPAIIWNTNVSDQVQLLDQPDDIFSTGFHIELKCKTAFVATGARNSVARVWNLNTGDIYQTLEGVHSDVVSSVFLFRNKDDNGVDHVALLTGSWDGTAAMWNLETGKMMLVFRDGHKSRISSVSTCSHKAGSPVVLTGGWDGTAVLWCRRTAQLFRKFVGHTADVQCVQLFLSSFCLVHPLIVTGSYDNTAIVWDYDTGQPKTIFRGHTGAVVATDVYDHSAFSENTDRPPLLITGSWDMTAKVWDLDGTLLRTVEGHKDSVVTVVCHKINGYDPFIVTGSKDKTAIVWGLWDGTRYKELHGHFNEVTGCCVYSQSLDSFPFILTSSTDKMVVAWDFSYPLTVMPPRGSMYRYFDLDREEGEIWYRIDYLSSNFGKGFWLENPMLFHKAAEWNRTDFFAKFHKYLCSSQSSIRTINGCSLLALVLKNGNVDMMRAIITSWIAILNEEINDSVNQRMFHPSFWIRKEELLELSKRFPSEFSRFICSLKLKKADPCVKIGHPSAILESVHGNVIGCLTYEIAGIWDSRLAHSKAKKNDVRQPVVALYLPLCHAADLDMLQAYVDVSLKLDSVEIFRNDVAITVLASAWHRYGKKAHIFAMTRYCFFVILFAVSTYTFSDLLKAGVAGSVFAWLLQSLVLIGLGFYFVDEYRQINAESETVLTHFLGDEWNVVDLVGFVLGTIGTICRAVSVGETYWSRCFLAVASVALWFKMLYFLRPFSSSGPLVSMMIQIALDIRFFMLILGLVICGFAQAFWLLSSRDESLLFGTVPKAFLHSFLFMLGNFDSDFSGTSSPTLSTFLLVCFLIFMTVLMLNLLIALMGDSFAAVNAKGLAQFRLEQASIVLEQQHLVDPKLLYFDPCIHVLKYVSQLEKQGNDANLEEMIAARFDNLEKRLVHIEKALSVRSEVEGGDLNANSTEGKMEAVLTKMQLLMMKMSNSS